MFRKSLKTLATILIAGGLVVLPQSAKTQTAQVDLALILAIDCSFSVDATEYRLQMEGLGSALLNPAVAEAIELGENRRIAILVFHWSEEKNQNVILPWTQISTADDLLAIATKLGSAPRNLIEGGTSMSSALAFASVQFQKAPSATRRVIDISTDGRNNIGLPVRLVRDQVVSQGITINGLAIRNEFPTLDVYLESSVVGGPSNFVMTTDSYADFGVAMQRKLIKEITGPGIS